VSSPYATVAEVQEGEDADDEASATGGDVLDGGNGEFR